MFKIHIYGIDDFVKETKAEIQNVKERIAIEYSRIGEEYVNEAKQSGSYQNRTTNLRNSNAYRVYIDGKIFNESAVRPETNAMFNKLKVDVGIQLVVGAGMDYASYVEGYGFNVVSSGFALVERKMQELKTKKI